MKFANLVESSFREIGRSVDSAVRERALCGL
jgi:hypothetical protein